MSIRIHCLLSDYYSRRTQFHFDSLIQAHSLCSNHLVTVACNDLDGPICGEERNGEAMCVKGSACVVVIGQKQEMQSCWTGDSSGGQTNTRTTMTCAA